MFQFKNAKHAKYLFITLFIVLLGFILQSMTDFAWYGMIGRIREAITTGDSGALILASASNCVLSAFQNGITFIAVAAFLMIFLPSKQGSDFVGGMIHITLFVMINIIIAKWLILPWETLSGLFSALMVLVLIHPTKGDGASLFRTSMIAILVFFAFQWMNVMPMFSNFSFGTTDLSASIKITSQYLQSDSVLNFVGMAFFVPLFITALITSTLFVSYDRNIAIAEENYAKEKALESIRSKAMENRIYQEINALAHDLKTPLVTIRGLNSLLSMTSQNEMATEYSNRIDRAADKMSEMISSFLYGSSRQVLNSAEVLNYICAQIPIDDDYLKFNMELTDPLPEINVNKIRVARALINVIENAIVVPSLSAVKVITIRAYSVYNDLCIQVIDNGIGIPVENLPKIWEMGYSTNNTSGLGLSFVKKVIEDNDGNINITSEINGGTTVTIYFPIVER